MDDRNRNLAVRVATALLLLPLVVWLIAVGGLPFALLVSTASAASALELNLLPRLAESFALSAGGGRVELSGAAVASVGAAFLLPMLEQGPLPLFSSRAILVGLVMVVLVDTLFFDRDLVHAPTRIGVALLGAAYPGLLISALIRLRQLPSGAYWIVLALVVTWFNDTGAYFAGRAYGRRKLYPRISPSKTWEGAAGGLVAAVLGALATKLLFLPSLPIWGAIVVGAGGSILGPVGDLSESMLKRAFGAKDSSHLLPGHGGILDRIDALLFNAPFVLLCARLFAP